MRVNVRTNTPNRLVVTFRVVSAGAYWAFGVLFMLAGAWAGWTLGRAVSVRCDRIGPDAGMCRFEESRGLTWQRHAVALPYVRGARTVVRTSGLSSTSTLVAMTREGDLAIPLVAADGARKDSLAAEFSRFVGDDSRAHFALVEDMRLVGWVFGALVALAGLACIAAIERVRLVLDRAAGTVSVLRVSRWRLARANVALARVQGVAKRAFNVRHTRSWSVVLQLDANAELPIATTPLFTDESAEQTLQLVRAWLA